jgi:glycosyltransferase involved in cell wall biosynthesis
MKICLIWTKRVPLTRISVRYERYARGFRHLGFDPLTVCLRDAADGYNEPMATAPDAQSLRDTQFWRSLRPDIAVVITWLGLPDVIAALKPACPWVVSLADSDGQIGVRVHPRPTFVRMTAQHPQWGMKLRAAKYWLQLAMKKCNEADSAALLSATHADRVVVGCPAAANHLRAFFGHHRRADLARKVAIAPYPIDPCYLSGPAEMARPARVVAIGRWDDPQKDAGLLCRAVELFLGNGARAEFVLVGPHGQRWFGPLVRRWSQVRYLGAQPPAIVAEHLQTCRVLLLPSRWEGAPIVLNEALASGCTIVGTDAVPSAVSACAGGHGTLSAGRSARRLAAALAAEMAAWDSGNRDPAAIAAHWRPQFDPTNVCRSLLAGAPRINEWANV